MRAVRDDDPLFSGIEAPEPLQVVDAVDLIARPYVEPRFLVRHLVPERTSILLSGDTGSAKTALALHIAAAIATGNRVAGRFVVSKDCGPVLFINGEMSPDLASQYMREALAGFESHGTLERGRLLFEGMDAIGTFLFSDADRAKLEQLVDRLRPSLIILDTQRALLIEDENDAPNVLAAFRWLQRALINTFGVSVMVSHHLRKLGPGSNSASQRVAGTRAILGSVDVHIAALAPEGRALNAILLDKARVHADGIQRGTEWPVEARLEYRGRTEPSRSYFVAGDPQGAEMNARERSSAALLEQIRAAGPSTVKALNATGGGRKRGLDELRKSGQVVECGRDGRAILWGLPQHTPLNLVASGDQTDQYHEESYK